MEPKTFGNWLKKQRLMMAMNQSQFAKFLGVTTATIVNYEKGKITPRIDKVKVICDKLNVDTKDVAKLLFN